MLSKILSLTFQKVTPIGINYANGSDDDDGDDGDDDDDDDEDDFELGRYYLPSLKLEEDFDKRLAENEKDGEVKISAEERATKDYMSIQEAENLGCKGTMLQSYMYYSMNLEYTKIRYTLKM